MRHARRTYSQTYPQGFSTPRHALKIARVALDVPLDDAFDFRVAEGLEMPRGSLVIVPFGRAKKVGVVVGHAATARSPPMRLKAIESVVPDVPPLTEDELGLLEFCARYYLRPLGEVIGTSLPSRLRQVRRRALAAPPAAQQPTAPARFTGAHRRAGRSDPHSCVGAGRISSGAAARRHGQRQDRGVPAPHRRDTCARAPGALPRSGDRAHAAVRGTRPQPFRRRGFVAAHSHLNEGERAEGVARRAIGRGADRPRHAARGAHAISRSGAHRGRRGARPVVQAAGGVALLGARRRGAARATTRHSRRARLRHALARKLRATRATGRYAHARLTRRAYERSRRCPRCAPSTRAPIVLRKDSRMRSPSRCANAPAEGRAVTHLREPARLLAGALLPRVLVALDLPALQREPGRCTATNGTLRCHHCGHTRARPGSLPQLRQHRPGARGPRHAAHRGRVARSASRGAHRARRPRLDRARAARCAACSRTCAPARSTSSSARRCSPRDTTIRTLTLVGVHRRRQRALQRRFPRVRAPLLAARAGVGPRGPRAASRRGAHPDGLPGASALRGGRPRRTTSASRTSALEERRIAGFPPFSHLALLRAESKRGGEAQSFLQARRARGARASPRAGGVEVFDPVAAPLERKAGFERAQLLVRARTRAALQAFLLEWKQAARRAGRASRALVDRRGSAGGLGRPGPV